MMTEYFKPVIFAKAKLLFLLKQLHVENRILGQNLHKNS